MNVSDTVTLKVTGAKVTEWTSSDTAVVAVSPSGKVTAKKAGIATVKATACASTGGKTYTCTICGVTK